MSSRHDTVDPMLLPSGNPVKSHEEVLSLQPVIPPKRFDIFFPLTGGCSKGLHAFRFFFEDRYSLIGNMRVNYTYEEVYSQGTYLVIPVFL